MQAEDRSLCPSCGTENPRSAGFCWQCYTSFTRTPADAPTTPTGVATTAFYRPGVPVAPSMPAPPAMSVQAGPSKLGRIAVVIVAALVATFGVRFLFHKTLSLPDSLNGQPRMTTQAMKDFEQQMADEGKKSNLDVTAAGYGTGATPSFLVLLVHARAIESTDTLFDRFVDGMASGGATVDRAATQTGERDGTEYRCVPVSTPQTQAAACMWRDDGSVGIVLDLDGGVDTTLDLLFTTHDVVT
ncbi:MAG: hypothetical protein ACRDH7_07750 [Actinomycetota bacterium]